LVNLRKELFQIKEGIRGGGTNKVIVGKSTTIPGRLKGRADLIGEWLGIHARLRCGLSDFIAVLVGTGEVKNFPTIRPVIARQRIGDDHSVGAPQVRFSVDVIERSSDVNAFHQFASTVFKSKPSITMRRFRFLCSPAIATFVSLIQQKSRSTLVLADCLWIWVNMSQLTTVCWFCVTPYTNRSRNQLSIHSRNLKESSLLPA